MSSSRPEDCGRRRCDNAGQLNLDGRIQRGDVPLQHGVGARSHFNVADDLTAEAVMLVGPLPAQPSSLQRKPPSTEEPST